MDKKKVNKIANAHWAWIEGMLESMPDSNVWSLSTMEYLYKTAFIHGWNHCNEIWMDD
jgi:hypothetical protein